MDGRARNSSAWAKVRAMDLPAECATQHSVFLTRQAIAAGWSRETIATAVGRGDWRRLAKGAFVEESVWEALDKRGRHLCVVHAALLTRSPGWHAGRRSAAVVHGLPLLGKLPAVAQLVRQPLRSTDRSSSRHDRLSSLPDHETSVRRNLATTSLARTVVDLARSESLMSAVVVADAALRQGLPRDELAAIASRCQRWPGGRKVGPVVQLADGLAESPLESVSRVSMHLARLPMPELQVEVWVDNRFVARTDNLWRDHHLVGEADGRMKYLEPDDLYAEKLRQQSLEDVGLQVIRWDWDTAHNRRGELTGMIRRGLARGDRSPLDPGVRFIPTTVEDALRRQSQRLRAA